LIIIAKVTVRTRRIDLNALLGDGPGGIVVVDIDMGIVGDELLLYLSIDSLSLD
jgi:hypothetical protein